jgi:Uri superfamily endonuclease
LRRYTRLECVWYACDVRQEHVWAAKIAAMPGAAMVLPGFGSSDCRCATHLYWFGALPSATAFGRVLGGDTVALWLRSTAAPGRNYGAPT